MKNGLNRVEAFAVKAFPKLELAKTRDGVIFDPNLDRWSYRDGVTNVSLDFSSLPNVSDEFLYSAKLVFVWYAQKSAPRHLMNSFKLVRNFVREIPSLKTPALASITAVHLLNYKASLSKPKSWYFGSLSGVLKRWHRLGYPGVDDGAKLFLQQMRTTGNAKGVAVLTMDPLEGPYSNLEFEALQTSLNAGYAEGKIEQAAYILAWLFILLGQRPSQHAAMKICDVQEPKFENGAFSYSIMVPRAKQRNCGPRQAFTERPLIPQFGEVLQEYVKNVRERFESLLPDSSQAPLFPCLGGTRWAEGFEYHTTTEPLRGMLSRALEQLNVRSERTGGRLNIQPIRFRRTLGSRAAEEGHGPLVIARLLDHNDTQNVGVYTASSPAIIERIDRAIAMHMAPIAQAFCGIVIRDESQATRGTEPSSRIIDLRMDRSGKAMGSCGQHSFCDFLAPIACYTCRSFEPWLDGNHEAVLSYLLKKRDGLLETTDKRIASVNDRTLLAVAQVILLCEKIREEAGGRLE